MILSALERLGQKNEEGDGVISGTISARCAGGAGVGVRLSGNLLLVSERFSGFSRFGSNLSERGLIKEFTSSSASRLRRYLRESAAEYYSLITLTYPHGHGYEGPRAKRDLSVFAKRLKRYSNSKDQPFSLFWFMEFQKRGSIHFHCFYTGFVEYQKVARWWYEICGTECEYHLHAGTRVEKIRSGRHGVVAYASKYAAKHEQKTPPADFGWVGRFWGVYGNRDVVSADITLEPYDHLLYDTREVKKLSDFLEDLVFQRKARVVSRPGSDNFIIILKDSKDVALVRSSINMIKLKRMVGSWVNNAY